MLLQAGRRAGGLVVEAGEALSERVLGIADFLRGRRCRARSTFR